MAAAVAAVIGGALVVAVIAAVVALGVDVVFEFAPAFDFAFGLPRAMFVCILSVRVMCHCVCV